MVLFERSTFNLFDMLLNFAFPCDGQHQKVPFIWRIEEILNFHKQIEAQNMFF